jgi:trimeric autotransporter adhesin
MRTTRKHRGDRGDTLLEVLLALIVIGVGAVAILLAFTTTIIGSSEYRTLATVDTVLRSAAESATSQIQQQPASAWANCSDTSPAAVVFTASTGYALPFGYTVQTPLVVQYWNPTTSAFTSSCVPNSAQLVQLTVIHNGITYSITFVVNDPLAAALSPPGGATHLAFVGQPGSTISGSPISPSPVVAVEDSSNNIVTTDLSPVQITITPGSGTSGATLSSTCAGIEFYGVVTFSNCSISMTGMNYTLTATNGTLPASLPSADFNILPAPASQLVFTKVPSGGQPVSATATSGAYQVQEQDVYGNPVTTGAPVTLTLATSSSGTTGFTPFFSLSSGGASATGVTTVVIPAGASTTPSFYYSDTQAGTPTLTASNPTLIDATASITTTPAAASSLAFTTPPPAATSTGTRFSVVVAEQDLFGNVETNDSSTNVTLAATGGSGFSCSTHSPARLTNGTVTFSNCSYSTSGSLYTLTASSGSLTPATASTTVVGPPSKLAFTTPPPASTSPGTLFTVVVTEQDASGNTEAGDSTTSLALHASNGGGGFSCTTSPTKVTNGVATYSGCSYTIPSGTAYTLTASSAGLTSATAATSVVSTPSKLAFTTSPPGSTTANTLFTVVVAEQDSFGNTVTTDSTTVVALAANNGGGGFGCTSTPAHVTNGVATFTGCSYTIVSGSAYTLTASSTGLTSATANTTVAGIPSKLIYTTAPPASTVAGTPFSVVVAEQDTFGNTETTDSSSPVNLAANDGGGGFSCSVTPTKVTNGIATFTGCAYSVASGTPYTLTASSGVLTSATANTTVSIGPPFKLVYTTAPPAATTAGTTFAVVVAEQDASGNTETPDSATTLNLAANNGGGGFACTTTPSKVTNGVATYSGCSYTVASVTPYTLTASSGVLVSATATTTVSAGTATKLVYTTAPPATTTAGATFTVVVAERDGFGNTEVGDSTTTLALAANNGGGGFACTSTPTHVTAGVATYTGCSYTIASLTTYTLTASSGVLTSATATTTVSAGTKSKLVYTTAPPATTTAGTTFSVVVAEQDAFGNTETADSATTLNLAANNGGGGFACTTTPTRVTNGVATFSGCSYTVASPTAYTLTASSGVLTSATANTTVSAGNPTKLVYTTAPPATTTAGTTFSVVVAEQDVFGNLESSDSATALTLAANNGGGGFSCTTTPAHVTAGVATYTGCKYTIASLTSYTLTASSGVLTSATANTTVSAGTPTKLVYTTAPPVTTTAGTTFTVVVAEQDGFSNTEVGDNSTVLALGANNGGGGFTCTVAPAHVTAGVATYTGCSYTVASVTAYTLTASSGVLTSATANTTVSAGNPTKLVYTTAPPATTTAGTTFSVVVAEQDVFGNLESSDSATALTLAANNGGGGFSCTTTPAHVTAGVATYTGCKYTIASLTSYTLTASSGVLTSATATTHVNGPATKLIYTTPPPATTTAGTTFSVVVAEEDAVGNTETLDNSTVLALGANNGGGGFACTSTPTHVTAGVATYTGCSYTIASLTSYTLTASSAGLTSATATTTVSAGTPTKLVYTTAPPAATTAGTTFTIAVAEQDASGNTEVGDSATALTLAANNGGGGFSCTVTPAHVTNGVATYTGCSYTVASGSAYTLTASSAGLTSATATTTVSAGTSSKLVYTTAPPATTSAGTTFTVVVVEQDGFGNTEIGDSATALTLSANNGGGGFTCTLTPAHVTNGVATYTGCKYTIASVTSYTLTASSLGLTSATAITHVIGPATKLAYTTAPPATTTAGTTFTVVVAEEDALGNTETLDSSTTLSLAANNGGGGFSCTSTPTHVTNGVATYTGCSYTVASVTAYTLTASSGVLTSATANTTVSAGTPTKLVYTTAPPATTTAGTTFTVVVAEQDPYGNLETGDSATALTLSANNGGGGFSCTVTPAHLTNGVATFTGCRYTIASGSAYTLTAASGGLIPATSTTTVSAGTSNKLVYTTAPPATTTAGTTFTVVVAEQDGFGNTEIGDSTTTLSLSAGGGFSCTATPTHVTNGVATFTGCSYTVASGSAYTLTASSAGLTSATSMTTVSAGTASKLVYTTAPPASASAGSTFTVVVAEQDAFGNLESADSATALALSANNGGGGFSCTATPTHVTNGVATYTGCSYTTASGSAYTLTASSAGLTSATATTTVTHGAANKVAFTTSPQIIEPSTGSGTITVQAQDQFGNPIPAPTGGYSVTLTTTSTHGTFTPSSPLTIAAGTSSVSFTYQDTAAGAPTVTARIAALANPTATQVETVLANTITATVTVSAQAPDPLAAGGTATYTVTVTNTGGARSDFNVTSVSGLPQGASAGLPSSCVTIRSGRTSTITLTVPTSATSPNGTSTLAVVATGYNSTDGSCSGTAIGTGQGDGALVVSAPATQLVFVQQPSNVVHNANVTPAINVLLVDGSFDAVTTSGVPVTLAIGTNPGGGTLSGGGPTNTAASGVATFTTTKISLAGTGYTLTASSAGLTGATSTAFNVT